MTLSLVCCGFHLVRNDRQNAVPQLPDVLGDEHETDAAGDDRDETRQHASRKALANAGGHVGELTAQQKDGGARHALGRVLQNCAGRDIGAALRGMESEIALGFRGDDTGDGRAVTRTEECAQALQRWTSRVLARCLDGAADLLA